MGIGNISERVYPIIAVFGLTKNKRIINIKVE
jgi:hypothetical protein